MFWIILISICLPFIFLSLYSKKWNNPFTLTFLFGRKGAGKSSYMVKQMIFYQKRGWTIYTDLQGVNIPGVRLFNITDLEFCSPPPKSCVFLDEVGLSMDNRNYKNFSNGLRDWYALQRHYKCRVFVNSQAFDVDKKVRDRVDHFLFLQKFFGCITLVRPIIQTVKPNDMSSEDCDSPIKSGYKWGSLFSWRLLWLPRYAKRFDSFIAPERSDVRWTEIKSISDDIQKKPKRLFAADKRSSRKT